jgi:hypothetical protein
MMPRPIDRGIISLVSVGRGRISRQFRKDERAECDTASTPLPGVWQGHLPQQLLELGCGEAGLAKDRGERSAFDRGVLRDDDHPTVRMLIDGVTAFGADVSESCAAQSIYHFAEWEIGQSRAHAAEAIWNAVTNGVASICGCATCSR